MKIYDMHIHADSGEPNADELIYRMESVGIYGGAVLSPEPLESCDGNATYEQRIENVLAWTRGYEGRLFPVLWIHPDEPELESRIRDAAARGITGYKMICDNYYVYDERVMRALRVIAELKKPVIFHSGIIWNGAFSSQYNKPVNWESLITIPNLRFSMGHCSWPWHDECIAMYGKFLRAYKINPEISCEMFFDLTPGTPAIYREDLIYKLFFIGYDVPHNIMFGTDSYTSTYGCSSRVLDIIQRDNSLYDKFKVPDSIRKLIYAENFLRFIGAKGAGASDFNPSENSGVSWSLADFK